MTIRRASILLPCDRLENLPTHLGHQDASELLAAWTALWHPALTAATGQLPIWHSADSPPDPSELQHELVVVPSVSRQRLAGDWCDRLRATAPANPLPVLACASRCETVAAMLESAGRAPVSTAADVAADFLALGYAHLQVELLTRAMRYSTVLDTEQFTSAVVAAAHAAVAGDNTRVQDELGRAFDLLADARNHVYSVDFYVVDVTLVAPSTLGESLRAKLATCAPCSLLASGELIEQMARAHPATLAELRAAIDHETVCVLGGPFCSDAACNTSPEAMLASLERTRHVAQHHVGRECEVFGQFRSTFSPLLPQILAGLAFRAALHAVFDGGRLPRAEQCKTRWGEADGAWLEALSATPLDASQAQTWLTFAEHLGNSIAHDHVATVLLAGWPGQESEYYDDLRRAAKFNPVLGKLVTLEEYFRITRETDDWTSFAPHEYPQRPLAGDGCDSISVCVETHRREVRKAYQGLVDGLSAVAAAAFQDLPRDEGQTSALLNPWNFACAHFWGVDPLHVVDTGTTGAAEAPSLVPDVPACGYAQPSAVPHQRIPLVDGLKLQNELLELTVSPTTGGIQSLRRHSDRGTRVSQRLVYHQYRPGHGTPTLDTQMVADNMEVARNDGLIGEVTTHGRLLDAADQLLARFTQIVRLARTLPAAIVDVQLDPDQPPEGDMWDNYFASRLAWRDEAVSFRRGLQWQARETVRERIESPEFIEISNGAGNIVCFGLGLPYHRRASTTWLDTLLYIAGQSRRRFQFALGLDCTYPTQTALALLTAGNSPTTNLPGKLPMSRGWFLHLGARNLLITHLELLSGERAGLRCRILETEGREVETKLAAYRPFLRAQTTDFRAEVHEVLSIVDGEVRFAIGPHRWIQIEAEW